MSKQYNFNLINDFDINYLTYNLNKTAFMKLFLKFLKQKKIKLIIYIDLIYINYLTFFNKLNLFSAGFLNLNFKKDLYNFPIFINNVSTIYNSFFLYSITYEVYMLALLFKYNKLICNYIKNFFKLNKLFLLT